MNVKLICINLKDQVDRRTFMRNQLGERVHFFDAIDAKYLTTQGNTIYYKGKQLELVYDPDMYLRETALAYGRRHYRNAGGILYADVNIHINGNIVTISRGTEAFYIDISPYKKNISITELACALSHYFVQKELALESDFDAYLVLEDDVIIDIDQLDRTLAHLSEYDLLCDIAHLNHPEFMMKDSLVDFSSMFDLGVFSGYSGAYSYILIKQGARKLMSVYNATIGMTADDFISNQIQLRQVRIKQPICSVSSDFESTIKTSLTI